MSDVKYIKLTRFFSEKGSSFNDCICFIRKKQYKTSFVNAVINELYELSPDDRLLILEDTPELQLKSPNSVFFLTSQAQT